MLKRLTKREVSQAQREFTERTAHEDTCRADCKIAPLCHNHPDHYVEEWLGIFNFMLADPLYTCN